MTTTPTLELVDPATLLVDRNIRTDLHIDKALIGSIKENGVLVPITVVRDRDGLRVRAGHRRTAAALEAGLAQVPVVVVADEDDSDNAQAGRVIGQIVENHHRRAVEDTDTVNAVAQLAAFGVSVASIARRAKLPKATVEAAAAVAGSPTARDAMDGHAELTLTHAAWIAEFDGTPDLQDRLLASLDRNAYLAEHVVQRLRDERDERAAVASVQARYPDLPWTARPDHDSGIERLDRLTDTPLADWPERALPDAIDAETHRDCPGHVAWLARDYRSWWTTSDNGDDAEAETTEVEDKDDPLTHGDYTFRIEHGCAHPGQHQARDYRHADQARDAGQAKANGHDPDEARKAERRRLIALNKAGDAAAVVRKEWLTTFSRRKTSPKDAAAFIWASVTARAYPISDVLSEGLPALRNALADADLTATTPGRAAHLHLCTVLWAHDTAVKRDSWRAPQPHQAAYLRALAAWGYPLAEVEQIITGNLSPEAAHQAITG